MQLLTSSYTYFTYFKNKKEHNIKKLPYRNVLKCSYICFNALKIRKVIDVSFYINIIQYKKDFVKEIF